MRSATALVALLILGGAGVFWWQRSQIVRLREQVDALEDGQRRSADLSSFLMTAGGSRTGASALLASRTRAGGLRRDDDSAVLRADERRLILDQYRDVIAEFKLPPATASHLQDLLMERIEVVLDAEDAAVRVGFAEGSAEMAQAVTLAIADVNREIAVLIGPEGGRGLNGLSAPPQAEPALSPAPAVPTTVVSVVVQAPFAPAPSYADTSAQSEGAQASTPYVPYSYYPFSSFFIGGSVARPYAGLRPGGVRPNHPGFAGGARVAMRRR